MRGWALWAVPLTGCIDPGHFVCTGDAQCGAAGGQCVAGSCVVPDADCDFGRYSEYAEAGLAGRCYEPGEADASSSGPPVVTTAATTSATSSAETSTGGAEESTGAPVPVEVCNGIDDDEDGLVDEWSPQNVECEICPEGQECLPCDLFPDDPDDPTVVYYLCHDANYNQVVSFCNALNAPVASIHDDTENTFLSIKTAEHAMYARAYVGLRDFGEPGAPAWAWVDGTPLDYERLGEGLDMHAVDDVCAAILTSGEWDAMHCNGGQPFFCEAPL